MTDQDELQDQFRRLARTAPQTGSPAVEDMIRAAFRARLQKKTRPWNYVAKIAATAVIAASLYSVWEQWTHRRALDQQIGMSAAGRQRSGFIALPYAQSEVPLEQPVIVRIQIPVSELGGMVMPVSPASKAQRVNADLLVGQDGVARAVRLVE